MAAQMMKHDLLKIPDVKVARPGLNSKHPGETAGVFELILGGAPLGSQLDCRRVSTDGGGLCGLISLLGRRPVPGE